jgi:hypothetical protein
VTASGWWLGLTALGGLACGLVAERRPFGDAVIGHPLIVLFVAAGLGLIGLRILLRRPVPEVIPDRALLMGCFAGLGLFLVGNWIGTHVAAAP